MKTDDIGLKFLVFVSVLSFMYCMSMLFIAKGNLNPYVAFLLLSGIVSVLSVSLLTMKSI